MTSAVGRLMWSRFCVAREDPNAHHYHEGLDSSKRLTSPTAQHIVSGCYLAAEIKPWSRGVANRSLSSWSCAKPLSLEHQAPLFAKATLASLD